MPKPPSAIAALVLTGFLAAGPALAQEAEPDALAEARTGRLLLSIDLKGSGRKDLSNKVEWYRLTAGRKLELEIAMVEPSKATAPSVPVGGASLNNVPMPSGMEAMAQAMKACNGNEACQRKAATAFGQQMMANPGAFSMRMDDTRFENWMVDYRKPCAKGSLSVDDVGDGVNISPPSPAAPYRFKRVGRLELPIANKSALEKACQVELSVDRKSGLLSLRIASLGVSVPVQLSGDVFTRETAVPFVEGGKIELTDQAIDPKVDSWKGEARLEKVGSASHNSGSTVAPLSGTIGWRFEISQ